MISGIRGKLVSVSDDRALIDLNGITYTVMITRAVGERLIATGKVGNEVSFFTNYYIEGSMGMGNLIPRLVGFLNETDLEFFSKLITVQGLSVKRSLKALTIPVKEVARAIELNDLDTLKKLPEIGGKTAQKIIGELNGKVAKFALLREEEIPAGEFFGIPEAEYQREAVEILLQLQYSQSEAESIVRRTSASHPEVITSDELIQEIFRSQAKT